MINAASRSPPPPGPAGLARSGQAGAACPAAGNTSNPSAVNAAVTLRGTIAIIVTSCCATAEAGAVTLLTPRHAVSYRQRDMRLLIVNADDLGYDPEIDRGVLEGHGRGVVTSTTAMVDAPFAA